MLSQKKTINAAMLAGALSLGLSAEAATGDDLADRIAELERQLEELKELVAAQRTDIPGTLSEGAVAPVELPAPRSDPTPYGTRFDYGGYVQLDAIASEYGAGKPGTLMNDIFVPSLIPVESLAGTADSYRSTNIHAKTSRFSFSTDTVTDAGKLSSFIELDFVLSAQGDERVSNSFSSRIRHAYLEWEYAPGQRLLAGQAWSTFMNTAAVPDLLDLVGPVGVAFERQPQIRWTRGDWQFALENQTSQINLPTGGTVIDDSQLMPDLVARYNARAGSLNWSLAALGRNLSYEARSDPSVEEARDSAWGFGLSLAGRWTFGRDDLRFMANYGDALGRYMGLNAFTDGYLDENSRVAPIDQWGGLIAYRHYWSDQWRSNVSLSASRAANPGLADYAAAGDLARSYRSMHINLNYLPAPKLQLGGELLYALKELEDGREGDMYRLQFAAKYAF